MWKVRDVQGKNQPFSQLRETILHGCNIQPEEIEQDSDKPVLKYTFYKIRHLWTRTCCSQTLD